MSQKRLLINWVYYPAIGHTVEVLHYAVNYRRANPDLQIAVALNARAGVELGRHVPGVNAVYPVRVEAFNDANADWQSELAHIPREWDYVLVDPRHRTPMGWAALDRCEQAFRQHLHGGLVSDGSHPVEGFPSVVFHNYCTL